MRHPGQRGDTGIPVPRRAAISSADCSNESPQSTHIGLDWPVHRSTSFGCKLFSLSTHRRGVPRHGEDVIVLSLVQGAFVHRAGRLSASRGRGNGVHACQRRTGHQCLDTPPSLKAAPGPASRSLRNLRNLCTIRTPANPQVFSPACMIPNVSTDEITATKRLPDTDRFEPMHRQIWHRA